MKATSNVLSRVASSLMLAALSVSLVGGPVLAGVPIRGLFVSAAAGGNSLQTIKIWPGYGLNLSFLATDERVEKLWLDNPSRIAIDSNGCLPTTQGPAAASCNADSLPQVLRLRQIRPIAFPGVILPPNGESLLSVIVVGPAGRRLYQFRVLLPPSGVPEYYTISLVPDSQGPSLVELSPYRRVPIEAVQRGVERAVQTKLIPYRSPLWAKTQNFIALVNSGETVQAAASRAGVSNALIVKLAELGESPPSPTSQSLSTQKPELLSAPTPTASPASPPPTQTAPSTKSTILPPPVSSAPAPVLQLEKPQAPTHSPGDESPAFALLMPSPSPSASAPPAQSLAQIRLALPDGRAVPAARLLEVWLPSPKQRHQLAKFISSLISTQDVKEASHASGMSDQLIAVMLGGAK